MADQKLIDEVGKYIDKYYEPAKDDIKLDKEMLLIFDRITRFRKKEQKKRYCKKKFKRKAVSRKNLTFPPCRRQR